MNTSRKIFKCKRRSNAVNCFHLKLPIWHSSIRVYRSGGNYTKENSGILKCLYRGIIANSWNAPLRSTAGAHGNYARNLSSASVRLRSGTAPTMVSFFSPSLKMINVGILRMPNLVARLGQSSVLTFTQIALPA